MAAIESRQPTCRADPQEAVTSLDYSADDVAGKPFFRRKRRADVTTGGLRRIQRRCCPAEDLQERRKYDPSLVRHRVEASDYSDFTGVPESAARLPARAESDDGSACQPVDSVHFLATAKS